MDRNYDWQAARRIKVVGRLLETELHELSRITQAKIADIEAKMKIWMQ